MDLIAKFKEQARKANIRIVLPEGSDERIVAAAKLHLKALEEEKGGG